MPARFLQSNLHEHNSIAMSRARDSAPPAKSWSRKYNDAQVGMSSPTRRGETGVHTPVLTADALRVQHSAPFDNFAGTRAARSGIGLAPAVGGSPQGSPTHKEASAARKSLGHSTSASLLPHIKPTASAAIAAESEEAKQQPLQSSLSSPNLLQTLRAERLARDASTTKLVTSYHSHHTHYQYLVQKLSADYEALLARTHDPRVSAEEQQLNRERTDGCMDLMQQLAAASPNSSTFTALVSELHAAMYNSRESGGMEFREFDEDSSLSYWQLSKLMEAKADAITAELTRVQQRANYYEFHESGERSVLLSSIKRRQIAIMRATFHLWVTNIAEARRQTRKLDKFYKEHEKRTGLLRLKKAFVLWKTERVRGRRKIVGPELAALTVEAKSLEVETTMTNHWINNATNQLKELGMKLASLTAEKGNLTDELEQIRNDLHSMKALKLQDVAHHTLDLARELLLALQDEIEVYLDPNGPYQRDGYKIVQKFVKPELKENEKKKEKATKKKKGKAAKAAAAAAAAAEAAKQAEAAAKGDASELESAQVDRTLEDPTSPTKEAEPAVDSLLLAGSQGVVFTLPPEEVDFDAISLENRLASLSDQDVMLAWLNYQLTLYHYRVLPSYDEYQPSLARRLTQTPLTIQNFSSDFASTRTTASSALLQVLESVSPIANHQQSMNYLLHHEFEMDLKLKGMLSVLAEFGEDLDEMVNLEAMLLAKSPDMVAALCAKLFVAYPNLPTEKAYLRICLEKLEQMKLARRVIFSRLAHISRAHAEFDSTYIQRRRAIEVSRIQASRFLRAMTKEALLTVDGSTTWHAQAREEEDTRVKEQQAKDEIIRAEQAKKDAVIAAAAAAEAEKIRKAKESLGLEQRAVIVEEETAVDITAVAISVVPTKKKTRAAQALEFERSRLAGEESALAAARAAALAAGEEVEGEGPAAAPVLDPFSPEEAQVYVDYVAAFTQEYHALFVEAKRRMDRIRRGEQIYRLLQKRMDHFILDVMVRRVNQDPLPIVDHKAHRDYTSFTTLNAGRLHDLLPSDPSLSANEILLLQGELANDYSELCAVFRAYSRVDHTTDQPMTDSPIVAQGCLLMHFSDWTELLKDLKLTSRNLRQSMLDEVFECCTEGQVASHVALSPNQFVEAIVRMAALKYTMASLGDSLALLLKQDLLKRCKKVSPDLLRSKVQSVEYLEMFRKHRRKLRKIFTTYAAGNGHNLSTTPNAERNTIDLRDLTSLLKFAKLLGGGEGISLEDVQAVFVNVKRSDYITWDNPPSDPELGRLDYAEFCQALAALANYKNPDPFTPYFSRLDHFLVRDFLPANR